MGLDSVLDQLPVVLSVLQLPVVGLAHLDRDLGDGERRGLDVGQGLQLGPQVLDPVVLQKEVMLAVRAVHLAVLLQIGHKAAQAVTLIDHGPVALHGQKRLARLGRAWMQLLEPLTGLPVFEPVPQSLEGGQLLVVVTEGLRQ